MTKSRVTKRYHTMSIIFTIISWMMCFGICFAFVIVGMQRGWGSGDTNIKEKLGTIMWGFLVSLIPMAILAIIVKDRVRPTVWMVNLLLAAYLYNTGVMWMVFGGWVIDQYLITPLRKRWAAQYLINREIDKRG